MFRDEVRSCKFSKTLILLFSERLGHKTYDWLWSYGATRHFYRWC